VGCTKVSAGCKHCYAETMAVRLKAMGANGYERGFKLTLLPERLTDPLRRKKPTVYFVNSMSDVFHGKVPFSYIDQIFQTIRDTPQHTYQMLTKRADRLAEYFQTRMPPENAWIGVSVENRRHGLPRIDSLRKVPAHVRFLSVEPLLESLGEIDLTGIHWVIVGGESGPNARPMKLEWLEEVQHQCDRAGVAFFFKQWGGWGLDGQRRSKRSNGRQLHGRTWDEMPVLAG
jgi:protein gp37